MFARDRNEANELLYFHGHPDSLNLSTMNYAQNAFFNPAWYKPENRDERARIDAFLNSGDEKFSRLAQGLQRVQKKTIPAMLKRLGRPLDRIGPVDFLRAVAQEIEKNDTLYDDPNHIFALRACLRSFAQKHPGAQSMVTSLEQRMRLKSDLIADQNSSRVRRYTMIHNVESRLRALGFAVRENNGSVFSPELRGSMEHNSTLLLIINECCGLAEMMKRFEYNLSSRRGEWSLFGESKADKLMKSFTSQIHGDICSLLKNSQSLEEVDKGLFKIKRRLNDASKDFPRGCAQKEKMFSVLKLEIDSLRKKIIHRRSSEQFCGGIAVHLKGDEASWHEKHLNDTCAYFGEEDEDLQKAKVESFMYRDPDDYSSDENEEDDDNNHFAPCF